MLVLTRKVNEVINIGDEITLTVTDIEGDTVRIGLEVPRSVPVYRMEIYEAILAEAQQIEVSPPEE